MSTPIIRSWQPIEALPDNWERWKSLELHGLVQEWEEQREELEERNAYKTFLSQMRRRWAIETGVLERLYSISPAATKTLIEKGFDAALLSNDDTDKDPWEVLALIKDQHAAIESLYQFVGGERPMGTSYIKELHRLLTQHQNTYDAVDSLGQHVQRTLIKGDWKKEANYVEFQDGGRIDFSPPDEVDPEMRKLLEWYNRYEQAKVAPEVLAAWFHHRFVLIHPFTDGNGRVARCLATLVFLKPRWFPLVVTRDDKASYIGALRAADEGDLSALVKLFGDLQQKAVRDAFSISEEITDGAAAVSDILTRVTAKWESERDAQKQQVFVTADSLHQFALQRLQDVAKQVSQHIRNWGSDFSARVSQAKRSDTERVGWYAHQVIQAAKKLQYWANRDFYHAWIALKVDTKSRTEILFSFHGLGRAVGTLVCSGMIFTRQIASGVDGVATAENKPETVISEVKPICEAPFAFSHAQNPNEVLKRFQEWLEQCVVRGLDEWRKNEGA
jgi:Fic family protein